MFVLYIFIYIYIIITCNNIKLRAHIIKLSYMLKSRF